MTQASHVQPSLPQPQDYSGLRTRARLMRLLDHKKGWLCTLASTHYPWLEFEMTPFLPLVQRITNTVRTSLWIHEALGIMLSDEDENRDE